MEQNPDKTRKSLMRRALGGTAERIPPVSNPRHTRFMPEYRRNRVPGVTFVFTLNLLDRRCDLLVAHVDVLREAVRRTRLRSPFRIAAWVVLPDHMRCPWTPAFERVKELKDGWVSALRCVLRRPSHVAASSG